MDLSILVTGANSQLARTIASNYSSQTEAFKFLFLSKNELDITSKSEVTTVFNKNKFDYCINCAAYTAVDKAEDEPEEAYKVNAEGARNLAIACLASDTTLIHLSTDYVFNGKATCPYSEDAETNPINVYGSSKLEGENAIQETLTKYYIIRASWLYSQYGSNFVKTMLNLSKSDKEIKVVADQNGSPTYALDLADAIMHIIINDNKSYGIYHFCNEGTVTWFELAKKIFTFAGINNTVKPVTSEDYLTSAKRPNYSVLKTEKIRTIFNVKTRNWEASLQKAIISIQMTKN